nr:MAG TPA: hypothetical protein [Caudoviricetes sp.]
MVKVLLDKLFLTSSGGDFLHGVFINEGDNVRLYYASEYGKHHALAVSVALQRDKEQLTQAEIDRLPVVEARMDKVKNCVLGYVLKEK